jgi:hypothetical protein
VGDPAFAALGSRGTIEFMHASHTNEKRASEIRPFLAAIALFALAGCAGSESPPVESPQLPPFVLRDVAGVEHAPFADASVKAVALVFVLPDCPIANGYAPEFRRIHDEYGPRGVKSGST